MSSKAASAEVSILFIRGGIIRARTQALTGWGNYHVHPARVYRPHAWREVIDVVARAGAGGITPRGLGRSYGDAALNDDGEVVLCTQLNRFLSFDPDTCVLECESGVSIGDLLEVFVPRGYFPPVTPGTKHVTIGGAIAADIHGKNHHRDGSFSFFVVDLHLLTATGEILTCSREEHPEVFWATVGGMGLTGVVLSARIRLLPITSAYLQVDTHRVGNLDEALARFAADDAHYAYSVAWVDCLARGAAAGRGVLMFANHADRSQLDAERRREPLSRPARRRASVPFFLPGFALNALSARAFNARYYAGHPSKRGELCHYEPFFYPLDGIENWNRVYGRRGFIQYQAAFEPHTGPAAIAALLALLRERGCASFLAVLKSLGQASGGLLSFARPGYTLSLDIPNPARLGEWVRALDALVVQHGGRVYLAKDACLNDDVFAAMYPSARQFKDVKQRIDPSERFTSSLARRIGLVSEFGR